jgi:hypothetical protein
VQFIQLREQGFDTVNRYRIKKATGILPSFLLSVCEIQILKATAWYVKFLAYNKGIMNANKTRTTGLLKGEEYRLRYSDTLIKDSGATLDEIKEISSYLNNQSAEYRQELGELSLLEQPLTVDTRVIVTIIAYGEGGRIKNTLEKYIDQDIDPRLYEIVLLDNHPESVPRDNTKDEISKFVNENPQIKIIYSHKVWADGEPATVGNARKTVFDIALNRIFHRSQSGETIIISHDADPLFYQPNYLSSILRKFDSTPEIDALVTNMSRPDDALSKPNVYVAVEILKLLESELVREVKILGEPADPAIFAGASYAMRASIVAGVGGCNKNAIVHDDREMGWLIADARKWDAKRIVQFDETKMLTDARRFMDAIANGLPADLMMLNFNVKPEIRQMNNAEVLGLISDDVDWELLGEDVNSTWLSQHTGNKLYAKKFPHAFDVVMKKLGIKYSIVNGSVVLKNIDSLLSALSSKYGRKVGIVHSEPIVYTDEMIQAIKFFFGSLSEGVVEARRLSVGR